MLWLLGLMVLAGTLLGVSEILMLFGAGLMALLIKAFRGNLSCSPIVVITLLLFHSREGSAATVGNAKLFLLFLKVGAILYGSGYVLFAFLDSELVANGLLTRDELLDAIAVGQFTPGPVFSAVTFVGYQINGFTGAAVATTGIFLPSFVFVALLNPVVKVMRNSQLFSAFLDAVNVASIAIILAVCLDMVGEVLTDWGAVLITLGALAFQLMFKKINSAYLVLGGALTGYVLKVVF
jgi:chromate transporter